MGILIILAPSLLPHDEAVTTSCLVMKRRADPLCPADISNSNIMREVFLNGYGVWYRTVQQSICLYTIWYPQGRVVKIFTEC